MIKAHFSLKNGPYSVAHQHRCVAGYTSILSIVLIGYELASLE